MQIIHTGAFHAHEAENNLGFRNRIVILSYLVVSSYVKYGSSQRNISLGSIRPLQSVSILHIVLLMSKSIKLKGVEWEGKPFSVSAKDIERPKIQRSLDITVCLTTSGICGTDLHTLHGNLATKATMTLGHEGIGIVEVIGEGIPSLKGDRVCDSKKRMLC